MTRLRLGLARAGTVVTTILVWTWLIIKIGVTVIGASTVGDDFNQLIDRLPKWAEWLFSTPWWVPASLATALTLFLIWLSWPRTFGAASVVDKTGREAMPLAPDIPQLQPYLEAAYIHPDPEKGPVYVGIPSRKGYGAKIFAEYQLYSKEKHEWSKRNRILIFEKDSFHAGPFSSIQGLLLSKDDTGWCWNSQNANGDRIEFFPEQRYRGRITFIGPEGLREHCWFCDLHPRATPPNQSSLPQLLNYDALFGFIREWEERDGAPGVTLESAPADSPKAISTSDKFEFGRVESKHETLDPGKDLGGEQQYFRLWCPIRFKRQVESVTVRISVLRPLQDLDQFAPQYVWKPIENRAFYEGDTENVVFATIARNRQHNGFYGADLNPERFYIAAMSQHIFEIDVLIGSERATKRVYLESLPNEIYSGVPSGFGRFGNLFFVVEEDNSVFDSEWVRISREAVAGRVPLPIGASKGRGGLGSGLLSH
jgi:hypothetical protein